MKLGIRVEWIAVTVDVKEAIQTPRPRSGATTPSLEAKRDRPELGRLLDHLRSGDVLTVTRLDRLARSTTDLFHIAERLKEIGAGLRSLAEPWADTTSPAGRMVLTIFAGIADFERSLMGERTSAGRAAAKAKGVRFGPKPVLTAEQITHARRMIEEGQSVAEVARLLGVHRATLYRTFSRIVATDYYCSSNNAFQSLGFIKKTSGIN